MLHISCPSCGERGKIPTNLVGARIKCKKCGGAFQVADPSRAVPGGDSGTALHGPAPIVEGIVVEGLDPSAWSLASEPSPAAVETPSEPAADEAPDAAPPSGPVKEYKLLSSRDRFFDGKFDLTRLEEAINHFARQGWTAKSICLPHVKNFQGVMQEEVVVLLER